MTQAERQRKYRRRCKTGAAVLHPSVEIFPLIEALIATRRLSEQAALDRAEVDRAVGQLLADFVLRWSK